MIRVLSEAGQNAVFYRWFCDRCGVLGGWTLERDDAEVEGRRHDCTPLDDDSTEA
ncbi:MAG TPA: hypothetical protein VFW64_12325 [Pseudonocardiaceae bacterium]|nr:hypothetical protein [Pseudonocardiaceae bacterium]